MRDASAQVLLQSFLREAIVSSSNMGRDVHWCLSSIFFSSTDRCGACCQGWFLKGCCGAWKCGTLYQNIYPLIYLFIKLCRLFDSRRFKRVSPFKTRQITQNWGGEWMVGIPVIRINPSPLLNSVLLLCPAMGSCGCRISSPIWWEHRA